MTVLQLTWDIIYPGAPGRTWKLMLWELSSVFFFLGSKSFCQWTLISCRISLLGEVMVSSVKCDFMAPLVTCFIPIRLGCLFSTFLAGCRSSAERKSMGLGGRLFLMSLKVHLENQAISECQGKGEGQGKLGNVLECFASTQESSGSSGGGLFLFAPKFVFNNLQV